MADLLKARGATMKSAEDNAKEKEKGDSHE